MSSEILKEVDELLHHTIPGKKAKKCVKIWLCLWHTQLFRKKIFITKWNAPSKMLPKIATFLEYRIMVKIFRKGCKFCTRVSIIWCTLKNLINYLQSVKSWWWELCIFHSWIKSSCISPNFFLLNKKYLAATYVFWEYLN